MKTFADVQSMPGEFTVDLRSAVMILGSNKDPWAAKPSSGVRRLLAWLRRVSAFSPAP